MPAYWEEKDAGEVRDVTGAGNSFLGGLIAGLEKQDGDVYRGELEVSSFWLYRCRTLEDWREK